MGVPKTKYTAAELHLYQPPPCPNCGGTNVKVNWISTPSLAGGEPTFIPGRLDCPDCPGLRT